MRERIETVLQPPTVDSDGDACEVANLSQNPQEHPQRDPQLRSRRILVHHGELRELFRMDVAELARLRGLADARAVRVKAALEPGRL
jgi:hypothetical protein